MIRMSARRAALAAVTAVLSLTAASGACAQSTQADQDAIAPSKPCADLVRLEIPGSGMTITKAEVVPLAPPGTVQMRPADATNNAVAIPAHCGVEGVIDPRTGADGKPYGLRFAIALPERWTGRFLFQGGGGLNGTLVLPLGSQATGDTPALARGFAVVSTDGGHTGEVFDASFRRDQQAALDFAFNAVPTVTGVAKQMVADYYGRPIRRSYFVGCSTGGREGMQAAQRYPFLFDGVVSGAPAMRTGHSNTGLAWANVVFNRIAPKDAEGRPIPGGAFSAADKRLIVDRLLEACDARDGVKDGLIFDTRGCRFDPAALQCRAEQVSDCLSAAQVDALKTAFAGPKSPSGRQIYPPFPYDTGIAVEGPRQPGFLRPSPPGPPNFAVEIDLESREASVQADQSQQLIDTYNWTNLSVFAGRGGKQIFYHGMSDPWFSASDTVGYFERLMKDNGGAEQASNFSRLFLVPGMGHCSGGPGALDRFDLLGAIVDWVENGKAPQSVTAIGAGSPSVSRPLCAYPLHAHYTGQGDTRDAASLECRP